MKRLIAFILLLPFAAVAMAAEATAPSTTVNVGWFVAFLAEYILPPLGIIVGAGLAYLGKILKTKWGLDIDANQRNALQIAITNAAGLVIAKGVKSFDGKKIDVGNPAIALGVGYVQDAVPGAMKHFGLSPEDVAVKIAAKLPQFGMPVEEVTVAPAPAAP